MCGQHICCCRSREFFALPLWLLASRRSRAKIYVVTGYRLMTSSEVVSHMKMTSHVTVTPLKAVVDPQKRNTHKTYWSPTIEYVTKLNPCRYYCVCLFRMHVYYIILYIILCMLYYILWYVMLCYILLCYIIYYIITFTLHYIILYYLYCIILYHGLYGSTSCYISHWP